MQPHDFLISENQASYINSSVHELGNGAFSGLWRNLRLFSSLIPRPSHPRVCCLQYLDVRRSGTFLLYSCKVVSESKKRHKTVWCQTLIYSSCLRSVAHSFTCWECATPPHVLVGHCTWLSSTRPSPTLVLQATNTVVRRCGYKASCLHNSRVFERGVVECYGMLPTIWMQYSLWLLGKYSLGYRNLRYNVHVSAIAWFCFVGAKRYLYLCGG